MKTFRKAIISVVFVCLWAIAVSAQTSSIQRVNLNSVEVEQIIKKFTKNEEDFRFALTNYVFNRSATIWTVGLGGLITGTYRRDSFMTFTKDGQRFEKITYFPISTAKLDITPADVDDLGGVNAFAINPKDIENYTFSYLGKETIDELNLHVFDVRPKVLPNPKKSKKRYFIGRIWVDDRDFMIVRSKGKGVPETKKDKFPVVDTWRINVDGKYWFPAFLSSDDDLIFDDGQVISLRMRVKYENYRQGRSEVIILDDDDPTPVKDDNDDNEEKPSN